MNCVRYVAGADPTSVESSTSVLYTGPPLGANANKVESQATATLLFPSGAKGEIHADLALAPNFGVIPKLPDIRLTIKCSKGEVELWPFVMPSLFHSITIKTWDDDKKRANVRVEKKYVMDSSDGAFKGEAWWTT